MSPDERDEDEAIELICLRAAYQLMTEEIEEAKQALGLAWLAGGVTLAEGIRRKTAALEGLH